MERQDFVIPVKRRDVESSSIESQIKLLQEDSSQNYVMILENNFRIMNNIRYKRFLLNMFDYLKNRKPDCIVLGGARKIVNKGLSYKRFLRLYHSDKHIGYIIKRSYIPKLVEVLKTNICMYKYTEKLIDEQKQIIQTLFSPSELLNFLQPQDQWYAYNDSTIMLPGGHEIDEDMVDLYLVTANMSYKEYEYYKSSSSQKFAQYSYRHRHLEYYSKDFKKETSGKIPIKNY